jgi:hypothetical protein
LVVDKSAKIRRQQFKNENGPHLEKLFVEIVKKYGRTYSLMAVLKFLKRSRVFSSLKINKSN